MVVVDWWDSVACGLMERWKGVLTLRCGCVVRVTFGRRADSMGYVRSGVGGRTTGAVK